MGRRKSIIGSYGGEFYVLLVVYVTILKVRVNA